MASWPSPGGKVPEATLALQVHGPAVELAAQRHQPVHLDQVLVVQIRRFPDEATGRTQNL